MMDNNKTIDRSLLINWDKVCPGCMRELTDEELIDDSCPHCGFNKIQEKRNQALPSLTILNGKYILGRLLSIGENQITYLGYDLNLETLLQIHEFFPEKLVKRNTETRAVAIINSDNQETYNQELENYKDNSKALIKQNTQAGEEITLREIFEENNTIYRVFTAPQNDTNTEILRSFSNDPNLNLISKKPSISLRLLIICILSVIILGIIIFFCINAKNPDSEPSEVHFSTNSDAEAYTYSVNHGLMLGGYYSPKNIAIFAIENSIYFSNINEDNSLSEIVPLTSISEDQVLVALCCDNNYIYYIDSTGTGVYRIKIASETITSEQLTSNSAWGFSLYDDYIYYSNISSLHRIKKDGSNDIVISTAASDYFTFYNDYIYYYNQSDSCIYKCDLDGSNNKLIIKADAVTGMITMDDSIYFNSNGNIYELNPETDTYATEDSISSVSIYTEMFVYNNELYFINQDDSAVMKYNTDKNEVVPIFEHAGCMLIAPMGNRIYVMTIDGEYYSVEPDSKEAIKLSINYNAPIPEHSN